jgi:hypothetical protein
MSLDCVQSVSESLVVCVNCNEADKHSSWRRIASREPIAVKLVDAALPRRPQD